MILLSDEAETALQRINGRIRDYRAINLIYSPWTRHVPVLMTSSDANALVDLVAITESYSVTRLSRLGAGNIGSWHKRKAALIKRNVDVSACPIWDPLMGYVDARNAIQHGLGRLTSDQLTKYHDQVLRQLDTANIDRNGDMIFIRERDVFASAATCAAFIRWLDGAAVAEAAVVSSLTFGAR